MVRVFIKINVRLWLNVIRLCRTRRRNQSLKRSSKGKLSSQVASEVHLQFLSVRLSYTIFLFNGYDSDWAIYVLCAGHPFDLTKTRLQTAAPGLYKGAVDVVRQTLARDGVRGCVY